MEIVLHPITPAFISLLAALIALLTPFVHGWFTKRGRQKKVCLSSQSTKNNKLDTAIFIAGAVAGLALALSVHAYIKKS